MNSTQKNSNGTTTQSKNSSGYKLSVEGVLLFLVKELFSLIPIWIWILLLVIILVRFLFGPLISLILFIHKYVCWGCCSCLTSTHRILSVSETRVELLGKMSNIKLGVWRNDDGTETKYKPLPKEKELMNKINYDLKHVLV